MIRFSSGLATVEKRSMPNLALDLAIEATASLLNYILLADLAAINEVTVGVKKGTITSSIQPVSRRKRIPRPTLGLKDPEVKQLNRVAGISGSKSCFQRGFRVMTEAPGTCTVMLKVGVYNDSLQIRDSQQGCLSTEQGSLVSLPWIFSSVYMFSGA